jgi:hypothetical protein
MDATMPMGWGNLDEVDMGHTPATTEAEATARPAWQLAEVDEDAIRERVARMAGGPCDA